MHPKLTGAPPLLTFSVYTLHFKLYTSVAVAAHLVIGVIGQILYTLNFTLLLP